MRDGMRGALLSLKSYVHYQKEPCQTLDKYIIYTYLYIYICLYVKYVICTALYIYMYVYM